MNKTIRIIIGILVGVATVPFVQMGVTKIWNLFGVEWGQNNLPFQLVQQVGALTSAFVGGIVAPFVSVLISRKKGLAIWIVFLVIGLSIDLYAALIPMEPLPSWFRIAWVVSVPIQVVIGIYLGGLALKRGMHESHETNP